jgi:hypothetical protein
MAKPKTTKGASKRSGGGKNRTRLVIGDPPILVGGGGSSFVWIRKDQVPKMVEPGSVPARAPQPTTPSLYYIFEVKDSHVKVVVDDGTTVAQPKPVNGRYHITSFDNQA